MTDELNRFTSTVSLPADQSPNSANYLQCTTEKLEKLINSLENAIAHFEANKNSI